MAITTEGYRYIVRDSEIRGGRPHIQGTRIGVHDVVGLFVNGGTVEDIVRSFPDLSRSQVYEALAYYEDHRDEVDLAIARQMTAGE